jgi:hypothetical protein
LYCTSWVPDIARIETTQALAAVSNVVTHPKAPAKNTLAEAPKPKLLDEVRARIRQLNYSIRIEDTYVDWERRFVLFHTKRHPRDMGATEIEAFLTHLAVVGEGVGFHAEPGQECVAVFLPRGAGNRSVVGRLRIWPPA